MKNILKGDTKQKAKELFKELDGCNYVEAREILREMSRLLDKVTVVRIKENPNIITKDT